MATKIKLGATPKTITRVVTAKLPDGTEAAIECVFKYRTRREFGAFIDGVFAKAKATPEQPTTNDRTAELIIEQNTDYLLQVLEGWNLDEALSRDNVSQLCNELPGVALAIMDAYRTAVTEGRLGN